MEPEIVYEYDAGSDKETIWTPTTPSSVLYTLFSGFPIRARIRDLVIAQVYFRRNDEMLVIRELDQDFHFREKALIAYEAFRAREERIAHLWKSAVFNGTVVGRT